MRGRDGAEVPPDRGGRRAADHGTARRRRCPPDLYGGRRTARSAHAAAPDGGRAGCMWLLLFAAVVAFAVWALTGPPVGGAAVADDSTADGLVRPRARGDRLVGRDHG